MTGASAPFLAAAFGALALAVAAGAAASVFFGAAFDAPLEEDFSGAFVSSPLFFLAMASDSSHLEMGTSPIDTRGRSSGVDS